MKVIKKICGWLLILAGGAVALGGIVFMTAGAVAIIRAGFNWIDIMMIFIFLLATAGAAGIMFAGILLVRDGRRKVKKKKEAVKTERVRREPDLRRYTLVAEDIFSVHGEGCIITGIVKGDTMFSGDKVWILGKDGAQTAVKAERLAVVSGEEAQKSISAQNGATVGFWTRNVAEEDVQPGSVIRFDPGII